VIVLYIIIVRVLDLEGVFAGVERVSLKFYLYTGEYKSTSCMRESLKLKERESEEKVCKSNQYLRGLFEWS